jgi:hypothetical protein
MTVVEAFTQIADQAGMTWAITQSGSLIFEAK